jgi:DNA-binding NarL/FixJ family response regulator
MSIALIDRRSATRRCLSRWFQQGSPGLRVVSASSAAGLINLSGSVEDLHLIVFSVGSSSLRKPVTFGQIVWLRQHMPRVPLVLLIDRHDMDGIVEAMAQGVRGFIATSMALLEDRAAIQCVAAGGTFEPASIPAGSPRTDRTNRTAAQARTTNSCAKAFRRGSSRFSRHCASASPTRSSHTRHP